MSEFRNVSGDTCEPDLNEPHDKALIDAGDLVPDETNEGRA